MNAPFSFVAARADRASRVTAELLARCVPVVAGAFADLVVLAGVAAIAYGISLLSPPAAWIFVGVVCIVIGVRGSRPPRPQGGV